MGLFTYIGSNMATYIGKSRQNFPTLRFSIPGASAHTYSIVKDSRLFHSVSRNCVEQHFYNTGCVSSVCVLEVFVWGSWNSGASIWFHGNLLQTSFYVLYGVQFRIWPNSQDWVQGVILGWEHWESRAGSEHIFFQKAVIPYWKLLHP